MKPELPIILKLGGSLLTLPDLVERLRAAIEWLHPQRVLVLPGGGTAADMIRKIDEQLGLPAEKAHWDAIAAMSYNAAMLSRLCSDLVMVGSREQALQVWSDGRTPVLDAYSFLRDEELDPVVQLLPRSWDVTSDSIAAWTASRWPASRLVLWKSCDSGNRTIEKLAANGMIDPWFTRVCDGLSVDWLNFRRQPFELVRLSGSGTSSESSLS